MKNKLLKIFSALSVGICFLTGNAYAILPKSIISIKPALIKIGYAMIGILAFSLLLYFILEVYNRIFVSNKIKDRKIGKYSLRTPTDSEDAVNMFIERNRLK